MTKAELRTHMRTTLREMSPCACADESEAIILRLQRYLPASGIIASYSALATEPETHHLHRLVAGDRIAYPLVIDEETIHFHLVADAATLVAGSFGIREPDPTVHPIIDLADLTCILVPGLAFSETGKRLGKGGGFYDRFLAANADVETIGLAFACQIAAQIPCEAHDIAVDRVITS